MSKLGDLQKKGLHRNSIVFFRPKSGDLPKAKGFHRLRLSSRTKSLHYSGPNNGKSFTTSAPKSRWGVLFSFFEQKPASKALKTCNFAYFSGQWEGSSSPAPLATLLILKNLRVEVMQISDFLVHAKILPL